jgi:hypothetical protein
MRHLGVRVVVVGKSNVYVLNVTTVKTCCDIVQLVEQMGSWCTERHAAFPTTDMEVRSMPVVLEMVNQLCERKIFPSICELYGLEDGCLVANDLFIVKYSADGGAQRALAVHKDQSHYSFNVLLSDALTGFQGGGTYFVDKDETVKIKQGQACIHPGDILHRGMEVTEGTRYILVGFLQISGRELATKPWK